MSASASTGLLVLFCPVSAVKLLPVVLTAVLLLLVLFVSTVCITCTVFGTLQVFVPLSVKICMGLLQGSALETNLLFSPLTSLKS